MVTDLEIPTVQARYGIDNDAVNKYRESIQDDVKISEASEGNIVTADAVEGEVAYISISQMANPDDREPAFVKDREQLLNYLEKIKDYKALVLDIRGNGGGNSSYWQSFLLPLIVSKDYESVEISFTKDSKLLEDFNKQAYVQKLTPDFIERAKFPEYTNRIIEGFDYVSHHNVFVEPNEDSINFTGKIYLLVDNMVYSSSEKLAVFAKESGLATLVGERTGGDGIGNDPYLLGLPNTGYIVRFYKELGGLRAAV